MGVATVFEVDVPASSLALAQTFERAPDATVQIERIVGCADDRPFPFAWISGVENPTELLAADPSVADAEKLGEDGSASLFELWFEGPICEFVAAIFERDGTVLQADATDGVWTFQLRFADGGDAGAVFHDEFRREYGATIIRLYQTNSAPDGKPELTEKQCQALSTAFDMDYYTVPRTVDLREVGEGIGISRQAVSERLRRGHQLLVADFLGKADEESD